MPDRDDPYRNFRFRIKYDGRYVAGISRVSGLTRGEQVITPHSGGDPSTPRRIPDQSGYQPIRLERGVTFDPAFEQWANKVWDYRPSTDIQLAGVASQDLSLMDFRRDIVLEAYNESGQRVLAYNISRCWPSEFSAAPEFDADGGPVAIASLTLENEGWERDPSVQEPA